MKHYWATVVKPPRDDWWFEVYEELALAQWDLKEYMSQETDIPMTTFRYANKLFNAEFEGYDLCFSSYFAWQDISSIVSLYPKAKDWIEIDENTDRLCIPYASIVKKELK